MNNTTFLLIRIGIPIIWALTPMVLVATRRLNYSRLKSLRRYMIVANLIVAALVTTPEILTQVIAAAGLQACYEVTVLACYLRERQKAKRDALDMQLP